MQVQELAAGDNVRQLPISAFLRTPGYDIEGKAVRVKTDERRQAIIDVALEVFREVGFERASMAIISRRLGGSKGTLYGYFRSKAELFETAMKAGIEGPGDQIMDLLDPHATDIRTMLIRFAREYLTFIVGSEVMAITRTAISEGSGSSLGPHLFEQGPERALAKMTRFCAAAAKRGKLNQARPEMMALHFKALVEAGFLEEALYGAPTRDEKTTSDAVDAFLRLYGV